jgi:hypothetical protein
LQDECYEGNVSANEDRDALYQVLQHLLARCGCLGSVHGYGGGRTGSPNAELFAKSEVDKAKDEHDTDDDAENARYPESLAMRISCHRMPRS